MIEIEDLHVLPKLMPFIALEENILQFIFRRSRFRSRSSMNEDHGSQAFWFFGPQIVLHSWHQHSFKTVGLVFCRKIG